MEWRIRKTSSGMFVAELGTKVEGGIPAGYCAGYFMPAYIVKEAATFDTAKEAKAYIQRRAKKQGTPAAV